MKTFTAVLADFDAIVKELNIINFDVKANRLLLEYVYCIMLDSSYMFHDKAVKLMECPVIFLTMFNANDSNPIFSNQTIKTFLTTYTSFIINNTNESITIEIYQNMILRFNLTQHMVIYETLLTNSIDRIVTTLAHNYIKKSLHYIYQLTSLSNLPDNTFNKFHGLYWHTLNEYYEHSSWNVPIINIVIKNFIQDHMNEIESKFTKGINVTSLSMKIKYYSAHACAKTLKTLYEFDEPNFDRRAMKQLISENYPRSTESCEYVASLGIEPVGCYHPSNEEQYMVVNKYFPDKIRDLVYAEGIEYIYNIKCGRFDSNPSSCNALIIARYGSRETFANYLSSGLIYNQTINSFKYSNGHHSTKSEPSPDAEANIKILMDIIQSNIRISDSSNNKHMVKCALLMNYAEHMKYSDCTLGCYIKYNCTDWVKSTPIAPVFKYTLSDEVFNEAVETMKKYADDYNMPKAEVPVTFNIARCGDMLSDISELGVMKIKIESDDAIMVEPVKSADTIADGSYCEIM
jgi:hypothetical protein